LEREIDRKNNSWEFGQNSSINEISNSNGHHLENQSSEETHVSPLSNADRIREIRNRKKGGKND
jgi:hypothetical protein